MLHTSYKLKDSVEVYIRQNEQKPDFFTLEFYRINTRERVIIESSKESTEFLRLLDGTKSLLEIAQELDVEFQSLANFATFLLDRGLITAVKNESSNPRFLRQIAFFDDLLLQQDGNISQEILNNKKVVLFGLGSAGSSIAILLARMGIGNFVFIDYKKLDDSHIISISIRLKPIAVNTNVRLKRNLQKKDYQIDYFYLLSKYIKVIVNTTHLLNNLNLRLHYLSYNQKQHNKFYHGTF